MNVKKILMFTVWAVVAVAVGLAVINRIKTKVPAIGTFIGA